MILVFMIGNIFNFINYLSLILWVLMINLIFVYNNEFELLLILNP